MPDPGLRQEECGLPGHVVTRLFQVLEAANPAVSLEELLNDHPVLVVAPPSTTLALRAQRRDGNALRVSPLLFHLLDSDRASVYAPLSAGSQEEALRISRAPALPAPTLPPMAVAGIRYACLEPRPGGRERLFGRPEEAIDAYEAGSLPVHEPIRVRMIGRRIDREAGEETVDAREPVTTTVGRLLFDECLSNNRPFINRDLAASEIEAFLPDVPAASRLLRFGLDMSTKAGLSLSLSDLAPGAEKRELIEETQAKISKIEKNWVRGALTPGERYNQIVDEWAYCALRLEETQSQAKGKSRAADLLLPSEKSPARSLRGIELLDNHETPVLSSLAEGRSPVEYFAAAIRDRKDRREAVETDEAAAGLTLELLDSMEQEVLRVADCGTREGLLKRTGYRQVPVSFLHLVRGHVARDTVVDEVSGDVLVREGDVLAEAQVERLDSFGFTNLRVRSPLTCRATEGLCVRCWGSEGRIGMAAGAMAAARLSRLARRFRRLPHRFGSCCGGGPDGWFAFSKHTGVVKFEGIRTVQTPKGDRVLLNRGGVIRIVDEHGATLERYRPRPGARLLVNEGDRVSPRSKLLHQDSDNWTLHAAVSGKARGVGLGPGATRSHWRVGMWVERVDFEGGIAPQLQIVGEDGRVLQAIPLSEGAHLHVQDGHPVESGSPLVDFPTDPHWWPHYSRGIQDLVDLLAAVPPSDPAVLARADGEVRLGKKDVSGRDVWVGDTLHRVPLYRHIRVHTGDRVRRGDPLIEGPADPRDLLAILGMEAAREEILHRLREQFFVQGCPAEERDLELVVRVMTRSGAIGPVVSKT